MHGNDREFNSEGRRALSSPLLAHVLFLVVAGAFSYYFASLYFAKPEWGPCSLATLIQGKGNTPFQYRALVPWIVGWAARHVLPLPGIGTPQGLAFVIEIASTFALLVAFRYYLGFFFRGAALGTLLAFSLVLVLPFNYLLPLHYPFRLAYDIPSVLVFTLGLILIYRRSWLWYYILFVVGTFNRETT